jgi:hypothetical protein
MKLELDAEEYLHLLYMTRLCDHLLHAYEEEGRVETEGFARLFQKIRANAAEAGQGAMVERDPQTGEWFESAKFDGESPTGEFIEEYNESSFWDEITARLGLRDADRAEGEERLRRMDLDEASALIARHEERWAKEWEQHGLTRLGVVTAPKAADQRKRR